MLNFDLTEEEQQIKEAIRDFAESEVRPIVQEIDDSGEFPEHIFKKLGEQGFLGLPIGEEYGGVGFSTLAYIICVEELARVCASTALGYAAHVSLGTYPIYAFASEEQKQKWLPTLTAGVNDAGELKLGSFGLTEPQAGSDAGATATYAEKVDGGYKVNGRKCWITNASYAGSCIFTAKLDRDAPRGKGIGAFIVDPATEGFIIEKKEDKLGMRSSNTCQLAFQDMFLPDDALVGGEDGFKAFMKTLDGGRISIGALGLGIAQGAFEKASEYVAERKQFGKAIGNFQGVSFKIADMAMEVNSARHLVYHAARLKDAGREFGQDAAYAKLYASEVAMKTATNAIQVMGGVGYCREYDVERMMRDAKLCEIGEGTSEIQRMVISRNVLGKI